MTGARRGGGYRLRRPLRLAAVLLAAAVLVGGAWWGLRQFAGGFRPATGPASGRAAPAGAAGGGRALPVSAPAAAVKVTPEQVAWVLILGVDRPAAEGGRADTIMLSRVNTARRTVDLVQFPPHTRVALDGGPAALAEAYTRGGAAGARRAVEQLLGESIAHVVEAGPDAFARAVDILGGVTVHVPEPMQGQDPLLDLEIRLPAGTRRLDGSQALQYARWRAPDTGESDPEVQRAQRQMDLVRALAAQIMTPANWVRMPDLLSRVSEHVQTDIDPPRQLELAQALYSARDRVTAAVAPGETVTGAGGPAYIVNRGKLDRLVRGMK